MGEYDGKGHREPQQHHSDNIREELFEDHGLVVTRATSVDYRHRSDLAARMHRARARGLARDRRADRWTLERPAHWDAQTQLRAMLDEMDESWTAPW